MCQRSYGPECEGGHVYICFNRSNLADSSLDSCRRDTNAKFDTYESFTDEKNCLNGLVSSESDFENKKIKLLKRVT